MISCETIQKVTGFPLENIEACWPTFFDLMSKSNNASVNEQIGMIATIATETNITDRKTKKKLGFLPISELGGTDYFTRNYELNTHIANMLGNTQPGDGAKYHGRGHIQCTGRGNYTKASKKQNVNFIDNPDLMLVPENSIRYSIDYFIDRKVFAAAIVKDWEHVRIRVNGGKNGWDYFIGIVNKLLAEVK